jgi:hypothetical protein
MSGAKWVVAAVGVLGTIHPTPLWADDSVLSRGLEVNKSIRVEAIDSDETDSQGDSGWDFRTLDTEPLVFVAEFQGYVELAVNAAEAHAEQAITTEDIAQFTFEIRTVRDRVDGHLLDHADRYVSGDVRLTLLTRFSETLNRNVTLIQHVADRALDSGDIPSERNVREFVEQTTRVRNEVRDLVQLAVPERTDDDSYQTPVVTRLEPPEPPAVSNATTDSHAANQKPESIESNETQDDGEYVVPIPDPYASQPETDAPQIDDADLVQAAEPKEKLDSDNSSELTAAVVEKPPVLVAPPRPTHWEFRETLDVQHSDAQRHSTASSPKVEAETAPAAAAPRIETLTVVQTEKPTDIEAEKKPSDVARERKQEKKKRRQGRGRKRNANRDQAETTVKPPVSVNHWRQPTYHTPSAPVRVTPFQSQTRISPPPQPAEPKPVPKSIFSQY